MGSPKARLAFLLAIAAVVLFFVGRAVGWWGGAHDTAPKIYGNVEIREVELGFRVGGRIAQVLVDEGDQVTPGQNLAREVIDRMHCGPSAP